MDQAFSYPEPKAEETILLVERAQAGEAAALEELFERYRPRLERWIALRLGQRLRSRLDVEDVVQETLAGAYTAIDSFEARSPASFRTWILSIAENRIRDANDWMHARKRDAAREQELHSRHVASITSPSMRAVRKEGHEQILAALTRLNDDQREVIRLVRLEGLSYEAAGEQLGITAKNAGVRLVRALKALREILREDGLTSHWA